MAKSVQPSGKPDGLGNGVYEEGSALARKALLRRVLQTKGSLMVTCVVDGRPAQRLGFGCQGGKPLTKDSDLHVSQSIRAFEVGVGYLIESHCDICSHLDLFQLPFHQ